VGILGVSGVLWGDSGCVRCSVFVWVLSLCGYRVYGRVRVWGTVFVGVPFVRRGTCVAGTCGDTVCFGGTVWGYCVCVRVCACVCVCVCVEGLTSNLSSFLLFASEPSGLHKKSKTLYRKPEARTLSHHRLFGPPIPVSSTLVGNRLVTE
jgi:hypothetical protein